ncbi:MAG: hypothetical protein NTW52_13760 [Planctomycetota bacterium]|nr:hypothetical protein [Planctomycetota bacterium]
MLRTINKSLPSHVESLTMTLVLVATILFVAQVGCSRSLVNQDSSHNASHSMRRASAAATPVQKSQRQSNIASQPEQTDAPNALQHASTVQTVGYEEISSRNPPPIVSANSLQGDPAINTQRIPAHLLPVSTMMPSTRPVPMNGTAPGQVRPAHVGCGGKCCSPQEGYSPVFPEFSTSGDLSNCGSCTTSCAPLPYPTRHIDAQEFIYDGGDRYPQARLRDDLSVVGLDSEDTIIRYETTSGSVELQTGCRVPIYSPRFSSIRKIVSLNLSEHAVATQATLLEQKPTRVHDVLPPNNVVRNDKPVREANVKVIEALRDRNRGIPVVKILPALDISDAFKPYEDLAIIRRGEYTDLDRPLLIKGTQAALNWTSVDQLIVLVDNAAANSVESLDGPQELFNYELGNNRVRLCKVASHQVAEPGDIIDFTIRFDNTGDQKITNIMIQDSLTPRLEYVVDSQKSSIASQFSVEPNDAGSSTLTWNITETVAPGTGGFLRFQCKVR